MADEEKPKKKWTWWGEKKPKPKSPLELRHDELVEQMRRVQNVTAEELRAARQKRQREDMDHNPMDAFCRLNRGRQSASSARCRVCRGTFPY